ncbi:hypothetical protein [Lactococcus formosensis]|uniref:hypothetical protein n=1 Tax=Lactococcus formosensis TaxID=1281486 RepID=UPI003263819E
MKKINIGFILLFLLLNTASSAVYALDSDVETQPSSSITNDKESTSSPQESELQTSTTDTNQTTEPENSTDQTSEETALTTPQSSVIANEKIQKYFEANFDSIFFD